MSLVVVWLVFEHVLTYDVLVAHWKSLAEVGLARGIIERIHYGSCESVIVGATARLLCVR